MQKTQNVSVKEQERALAVRYRPVFWLDEKEPFSIDAIGYTFFYREERSDSFPKRVIRADFSVTDFVIEYAVWFDYDIQHLYELEHVWVYVGKDGLVQKVEGSFHGKYLNEVNLDTGLPAAEGGRPAVYLQPGKHAVLPDPRLVRLVPDWQESCKSLAGADGFLIQDMFADWLPKVSEAQQQRVRDYIRSKYAFTPSLRFRQFNPPEELLMPWRELKESIPERVCREFSRIMEAS